MGALKGELWYHLRTNLSPVFTSRKIKLMFNLVDTSGKELAECLERTTLDGKLPQDQYCYKMHWNINLQKLKNLQGYKISLNN